MSRKKKLEAKFDNAVKNHEAEYLLSLIICSDVSIRVFKDLIDMVDEMGFELTKQFIEISNGQLKGKRQEPDNIAVNAKIRKGAKASAINLAYSFTRNKTSGRLFKIWLKSRIDHHMLRTGRIVDTNNFYGSV